MTTAGGPTAGGRRAWRYIKRTASNRAGWLRADGARIERTSKGDWRGWDIAGEPVRVDSNADGTPYTPRPWHEPKDKPIIRMFPSASFAKRIMDKEHPGR